jgi:hypothetical protein
MRESGNQPLISCNRRPNVFADIQEYVYNLWVKLTSGKVADRITSGLERRSTPVGSVGCNGIESVRYGEDSRAGKNLLSFEPTRIAFAVESLVVHENDFRRVSEKRDVLDDIESDLHMLLHEIPLALGERSRLEQNPIGDSEFPDIVQISSSHKAFQLLVRPAHCSCNLERVTADTPGMAGGLTVAEIDRRPKRLQCVFITSLDLLEGALQLLRALRDHFFKMLPVVFDLLFEFPFVQRAFDACQDGAVMERFDEIVVRTAAHRVHADVHIIHARSDQKGQVGIAATRFGEEFHTTDAGHLKVGNDHVEPPAPESHERFFAIAGSGAVKRGGPEDEREEFASGGFVVDDQNAYRGLESWRNLGDSSLRFSGESSISLGHPSGYPTFYCSTQGPVFSMKRHP